MLTDSSSHPVDSFSRRKWLGPVIFLIVGLACLALVFVTMRQVTLYEDLREIDRAWIGVDRAVTQRSERALQLAEQLGAAPRILRLVGRLDAAPTPRERIEANQALDEAIEPLRSATTSGERKDVQTIRDSLDEAERDIAVRRREYNDAVQEYNTRIQLFPDNFASWVAGLERVEEYVR